MIRKKKEQELKEQQEMRKMVEDVKKDARDAVKIRKKMSQENKLAVHENANYIKDTSNKIRAEIVDRGDKYTIEIYKPKVLKEIFCFNHEKNYINMIEQAEKNGDEKSKFKQFKQQVEKNLDKYIDPNYYRLLYEKHKKETEKTKKEEEYRKKQMADKKIEKMSKSQAAKFYSMHSSKTFRRKQLLTTESVDRKEIKSPKEECMSKVI